MKTKEQCTAYIDGPRGCGCESCANLDRTCARCGEVRDDVERHHDRRGIYITRACAPCWRIVRKGFKLSVLRSYR